MIGIIGGGLSGVSLQYFLEQESEILEKENTTGGLCRTFEKDGFHYDVGGHILFSRDRSLMDIISSILGDNLLQGRRNNKILYAGRYVKYPFENGLSALDRQDVYECLIGFLANQHPAPDNFKEWIYHIFGDGIAEKYLVPYNEKIWKVHLDEMGLEWVERVPSPPLEDIVKSALGIETEGYVHQLNFLYPKTGGIESLVHSFEGKDSSIKTGFEVRKIKKDESGWIVSDEREERRYDKLVVTTPIKEAVGYFEKIPDDVSAAVNGLRHNSVSVVLVGLNNESLMDKSAVYIPDPDVAPHRVCFMGYFSGNNVPAGKSSLIAEITRPGNEAADIAADEETAEKVIEDLDRIHIIDRRDITTVDVTDYEYGYVVQDVNHVKNTKIIKDYFQSVGIALHGRFAEFEYINMDEVIDRSRKLAIRLDDRRV